MEEKPKNIETLREVMKKAAARDADLQKVLETTAINVLKDLGFGDGPPEWAEIKTANAKERQVTPHFTLEDRWLRGDLVFKVAPEGALNGPAPATEGQAAQFVVSMLVREGPKHTHEAGTPQQRSQAMIIDPPDEKDRNEARGKFAEMIFSNLDAEIRQRFAFPDT